MRPDSQKNKVMKTVAIYIMYKHVAYTPALRAKYMPRSERICGLQGRRYFTSI